MKATSPTTETRIEHYRDSHNHPYSEEPSPHFASSARSPPQTVTVPLGKSHSTTARFVHNGSRVIRHDDVVLSAAPVPKSFQVKPSDTLVDKALDSGHLVVPPEDFGTMRNVLQLEPTVPSAEPKRADICLTRGPEGCHSQSLHFKGAPFPLEEQISQRVASSYGVGLPEMMRFATSNMPSQRFSSSHSSTLLPHETALPHERLELRSPHFTERCHGVLPADQPAHKRIRLLAFPGEKSDDMLIPNVPAAETRLSDDGSQLTEDLEIEVKPLSLGFSVNLVDTRKHALSSMRACGGPHCWWLAVGLYEYGCSCFFV